MASEINNNNNNIGKKRKLWNATITSNSKIWLIPHLFGFLSFMVLTYRTYDISGINEGVNVALGHVSTTESLQVKTFAKITDLSDTWKFIETNLLPAIKSADVDYMAKNHYELKKNGYDMHIHGKILPVSFLPMTIEQTRDEKPPICQMYDETGGNEDQKKKFIKGLGGRCDELKDKQYLDSIKYGKRVIGFSNNTVESEVCDISKKYNITSYDPFKPTTSSFRAMKTVYTVQNLSPKNGDIQPNEILDYLKKCYWTDLSTRELFFSLPFVVRGSSVYGTVQYSIKFSDSGSARTQYTITYAKRIQTALEYYSGLSSKDSGTRVRATQTLFCRFYIVIYLFLELVIRNMKKIIQTVKKVTRKEDNKEKHVCCSKDKMKQILNAIFPTYNEILTFLILLLSTLVLSICNGAVNFAVVNVKDLLVDYGAGNRAWDASFATDFNKQLTYAQTSMWVTKVVIVVIIASWLWKLMVIFNQTSSVNVVPQTLLKSIPKILRLMIVILTMMMSFGVSAMVYFGHISSRWVSPFIMFLEVYAMMLGEYGDQYSEMYQQDRLVAIVLFVFFTVFLMMTLMNIFMSVILNTYSEVNSEEYQQYLEDKEILKEEERELKKLKEGNTSAEKRKPSILSKLKNTKFVTLINEYCIPKRRNSMLWVIPHYIGFSCFLYSVYLTYGLSVVNEGITSADNYISTTETPSVKIFDNIQTQSDLFTFLETNLIPVIAYKSNMDYRGESYIHASQNVVPFIWLPINVEQTRFEHSPACTDTHGFEDADKEKKAQYLKALGVDCEVESKRKFGDIAQPPKFNSTLKCPKIVAFNMTVDPFEKVEPLLISDKSTKVYRLSNLAPYTKPYSLFPNDQLIQTIRDLKECYWFDLQTQQVIISLPFIVKGSGVFGSIQYTINFSPSGVPTLSKSAKYAKRMGENVMILLFQTVSILYLLGEIVLRRFDGFNQVCCQKRKKSENGEKQSNYCVYAVTTIAPQIPEYIGMGLIWAIISIQGIVAAINIPVNDMIKSVGDLEDDPLLIQKAEFAKTFSANLVKAQNSQMGFNGWNFVVIYVFLIKMLIAFSEIDHIDVVPITLVRSALPLFYLMIVIIAIMIGFSGIAMVLFGHIVIRWTDPFLMMVEVYQMMLGDWGDHYGEMYGQNQAMAVVLFLFFSLILMLVVVNIFLSIVLDNYEAVYKKYESEQNKEQMKTRLITIREKEKEAVANATKVVPVTNDTTKENGSEKVDKLETAPDNLARLKEVREMYGAGSKEYLAAMEQSKKNATGAHST